MRRTVDPRRLRDVGLLILFARVRMAGTRRGMVLGRMGLERFRKMVKSG